MNKTDRNPGLMDMGKVDKTQYIMNTTMSSMHQDFHPELTDGNLLVYSLNIV